MADTNSKRKQEKTCLIFPLVLKVQGGDWLNGLAMSFDEFIRFLQLTTFFGVPLWVIILVLVMLYYLWASSKRRH